MAKVSSPYGLRPAKGLGESYVSTGFLQYAIASAYGTDLKTGDLVSLISSGGTIQKEIGTTTATPIGVFLGCSYTDASLGFIQRQIWKAGTVATDAMAYVMDDPRTVFQIQASGPLNQNALGCNAAAIQGAGNATLGISGVSLNAGTLAVTATLPFNIVGFVNEVGFSVMGDAYTDVLVRLNTHFHLSPTGNAP